ncbi:MAG: hypothetical protein ABIJ65_09595 [Chloroflexota bacterium]
MNKRSAIFIPVIFLLLSCSLINLSDQGVVDDLPEETIAVHISLSALTTSEPLLCNDPQPAFVLDLEVFQPNDLTEPTARIPFRDPIFGTCLVRVTDRRTDLSSGDPSGGLKNEYSRVQSFNANDSLIMVRSTEANWYLYDAKNFQPFGQVPIAIDPRWDPVDPAVLYFSAETRLMKYNVETGSIQTVHDFASDFPGYTLVDVSTRYEGSPSLDGRYWGMMAQDENWEPVALLVYDMQEDRLIASRDLDNVHGLDSVTISPLGTYFLAYFDHCESGLGSDNLACGLMVYGRDLQNGRGMVRAIGHSDLALDAEGREVVVFQDVDHDTISMLDLETGQSIPLYPIDFSFTGIGLHFSGQSYNMPGWIVVSTHDGDISSHTWMDDQVFALELKANGRVVHLAHTHSLVDENQEHDYWSEPQASVNRDFSRVLFTSNWGRSGTDETEMYIIELPQNWNQNLP